MVPLSSLQSCPCRPCIKPDIHAWGVHWLPPMQCNLLLETTAAAGMLPAQIQTMTLKNANVA